MRRALVIVAVSLSLALTACGGAGTATTVTSPSGATASSAPPADGDSEVDCSGITKKDFAQFILFTQLLAQVRSDAQVEGLREGSVVNYTPESFSAFLAKLGVLAGHPGPGSTDPSDAIAYWKQANDLLASMISGPSPVPQPKIDEYLAATGGVAAALQKQLPIASAMSEYCPDLRD